MNITDLVTTLLGYFIINVLSLIIAARVKKHVGAVFSHYTFVFVAALAFYYLVDVIVAPASLVANFYFYLWMLVIFTQAIFFIVAKRRSAGDEKL